MMTMAPALFSFKEYDGFTFYQSLGGGAADGELEIRPVRIAHLCILARQIKSTGPFLSLATESSSTGRTDLPPNTW
jgi:hypothetical protein